MYFIDTETCGFNGPATLIQWAKDDGEIQLHEVWFEPIHRTLELIEELCSDCVVGFNLAFDWFQLQKLYNVLSLAAEHLDRNAIPLAFIDEIANLEADARDGLCIKPQGAFDLMLHARKGPYQSTMDRKDVRIKRVPKQLAVFIQRQLTDRIKFNSIYFKNLNPTESPWKLRPIKNSITKQEDDHFIDIILQFNPTSALKAIVKDAGLRGEDRLVYSDVEPQLKPIEISWAPFATAISSAPMWFAELKTKSTTKKGFTWPKIIEYHAGHWRYNEDAREYAYQDVEDTRNLYYHFDSPEVNDDDSVLACMVGSIRWRGYSVDLGKINEAIKACKAKIADIPLGAQQCYSWLQEVMTPDEMSALTDENGKETTKKVILESVAKWTADCACVQITHETHEVADESGFGDTITLRSTKKQVDPACKRCKGTGQRVHPAAKRAQFILDARQENTKLALLRKLKVAKRFHPAASVIGSLSGRMSGRTEGGSGQRIKGLNALGIQHDKKTRAIFTFAHPGMQLTGGDFDAFEISIAVAAWNDPDINRELLTCNICQYVHTPDEFRVLNHCPKCGKKDSLRKIHALFAMALFPGKTYDEITATKGTSDDLYDKGKRGLFGGVMYGGNEDTLVRRIGIPYEDAKAGREAFFQRYSGVQAAQKRCYDSFCSMRQPGGIGKKVEWHEPKDYVESLLGFRRWFTLENKITKALFDLAENPPEEILDLQIKVQRRKDGSWQKIGNAVRSALFAAAFQIQAQCMRAALNHEIQSTGAGLTKKLQRNIWNLQPAGIGPWLLMPMNIHDEVICPSNPEITPSIVQTVSDFIEEYKGLIPLIKMQWKTDLETWADK